MLAEAKRYSRMWWGLADYIRQPRIEDAKGLIAAQRQRRVRHFVELLREEVWPDPGNVWRRLLAHAGIEERQMEAWLEREEFEAVLERLYEAGVRVEHDEFKGHRELRRGSLRMSVSPEDFARKGAKSGLAGRSGGSRSKGTIGQRSVENLLYREAWEKWFTEAFGIAKKPRVLATPVLPSLIGLRHSIAGWRIGQAASDWFAARGPWRQNWHYQALTAAMVARARWAGVEIPYPSYLGEGEVWPLTRSLAERRPYVVGSVSVVTRAVREALEKGLDVRGTWALIGGEPLSNAKRAILEEAGVSVLNQYTVSEVGFIGLGCPEMKRDSTVHLLENTYGMIVRRRQAPLTEEWVDSLAFSSAQLWAPFVLINAEMEDAGILEAASCSPDCPLHRVGYRRQLRGVQSYGKLTGEGVTLLGSSMVEVLEEVLPRELGGGPGDYQLVEKERDGRTVLELRVNLEPERCSEARVRESFLRATATQHGGSLARRQWQYAEGLEISYGPPYRTPGGKVLPLHLLRGTK